MPNVTEIQLHQLLQRDQQQGRRTSQGIAIFVRTMFTDIEYLQIWKIGHEKLEFAVSEALISNV